MPLTTTPHTPARIGRSLLLAALGCSAALAGQAQVLKNMPTLEEVRQLPYQGPRPSLQGFAPAKPVPVPKAPTGDHDHGQAYRNAQGCVVFFRPLGPELSELGFRWNGPACEGEAVNGKGQLQVRTLAKDHVRVAVLEGHFVRGMLSGPGRKQYFHFKPDGTPYPGVHHFKGEFRHSVLHGEGEASWSGAADERPSAWLFRGRFLDGLQQGAGLAARLRPYPGVEAEVLPMVFALNGEPYVQQSARMGRNPPEGMLYMERDPLPWRALVETWEQGIVAGRLMRFDVENESLAAGFCAQWRFDAAAVSCERGEVLGRHSGLSAVSAETPFELPLPVNVRGWPHRVPAGTEVGFEFGEHELKGTCDADMRRCEVQGSWPLIMSPLYWAGRFEVDNAEVRPLRAALRVGRADAAPDADGDKLVASCDDFGDALSCSDGRIPFDDGGEYVGAWRLKGVAHKADAHGVRSYVATGRITAMPMGRGTMVYPDRSWADVRFDSDGDLIDVDDCGDPNRDVAFRCHLDGATVVFSAQRNERAVQRREPVRVQRHEPRDYPRRQPTILPGMR